MKSSEMFLSVSGSLFPPCPRRVVIDHLVILVTTSHEFLAEARND
jgi:hypothetical protein